MATPRIGTGRSTKYADYLISSNPERFWQAVPSTDGTQGFSSFGSAVYVDAAPNNMVDGNNHYCEFVTPATAGQRRCVGMGGTPWTPFSGMEYLRVCLKTGPNIANVRIVAGLTANINMTGYSDDPNTDYAGFFYNPAVSANWLARTKPVGGAVGSSDTGIAVAADTTYDLLVDVSDVAAQVKFWIDYVLRATRTTNLPTSTNNANFCVGVTPTANEEKRLKVALIKWGFKTGSPVWRRYYP